MTNDFNPGTATIISETRVNLPSDQSEHLLQPVHGLPPAEKKKPKRKYRNEPCVADGIKFHSKKEADRWQDLKVMEMAGVIRDLERQVRYPLMVNGERVSLYTADFRYVEVKTEEKVVEDTKSEATCQNEAYGIRKRLMKALYGIEILET